MSTSATNAVFLVMFDYNRWPGEVKHEKNETDYLNIETEPYFVNRWLMQDSTYDFHLRVANTIFLLNHLTFRLIRLRRIRSTCTLVLVRAKSRTTLEYCSSTCLRVSFYLNSGPCSRFILKCSYASAVASRPLEVRFMKPSMIKKGSNTSSIV